MRGRATRRYGQRRPAHCGSYRVCARAGGVPPVANRRPSFDRSCEEIAAGPEKMRPLRQGIGQWRVDVIRRQRIRRARSIVRQPHPRHRSAGEDVDRRMLVVTEAIGAAIHPHAALGKPSPRLRAGDPHDRFGRQGPLRRQRFCPGNPESIFFDRRLHAQWRAFGWDLRAGLRPESSGLDARECGARPPQLPGRRRGVARSNGDEAAVRPVDDRRAQRLVAAAAMLLEDVTLGVHRRSRRRADDRID